MAASGTSFAQSSVAIKGTFDPSFVSQKNTYGNGNSVTQTGLQNNRQGTSQVTFNGTEDLGGGLKASFLIENDFTAQTAGSWNAGGGELFVGLSGGFGTLKLGAPNTPTLSTQAGSQPFGTKIGGGFGSMSSGKVRNNNSVRYDSPSFGGLTVAIAMVNKTAADANPTTVVAAAGAVSDIGLFYANGPVAIGYSNYKVNGVGAAVDNTINAAYLNYDLGVAKLGFGYSTEKNGAAASATVASGATDSQATNFSVSMPMGAITLMANYGKKNDKAVANNDRTVTALGAKYDLSKRTSVYARMVNDKVDGTVAAVLAAKSSYTIVGLQHNF